MTNHSDALAKSPLLAPSGWAPWQGGACPVDGGCLIEAKRRYGPPITAAAASLYWWHDQYNAFGADDIVAFRLIAVPTDGNQQTG